MFWGFCVMNVFSVVLLVSCLVVNIPVIFFFSQDIVMLAMPNACAIVLKGFPSLFTNSRCISRKESWISDICKIICSLCLSICV